VPTYERTIRFQRDFDNLTPRQQRAVLAMVRLLVTGLREKRFAPRLRVKRVQRHEGIWEVTWAADGRATFEDGAEVQRGEPHIIWRLVGTPALFREPCSDFSIGAPPLRSAFVRCHPHTPLPCSLLVRDTGCGRTAANTTAENP